MQLTRLVLRWLLAILFATSSPAAMAYIGPGAGAGLIATVLGLLAALVLALLGIVYYPLKRFLRNRKSRQEGGGGGNETGP
jgi:hypothetical protein